MGAFHFTLDDLALLINRLDVNMGAFLYRFLNELDRRLRHHLENVRLGLGR